MDNNISDTDARYNKNPLKSDEKKYEEKSDTKNVRVFSADKITIEKIVLESSNGSREVLLTKNETSRKLSLCSETKPNVIKRTKDVRQKSTTNGKYRISVPEDTFTSKAEADFKINVSGSRQSKLPIPKYRKGNGVSSSSSENRIKPIKLTKSPSISSIVIEGLNSANVVVNRNKVPPKVPEKSATKREHNSSSIVISSTEVEPPENLQPNRQKVADKLVVEVEQEQSVKREISEAEGARNNKKDDEDTGSVRLETDSETGNIDYSGTVEIKERSDTNDFESSEEYARADKGVQERLEKSRTTIEDLQKNLSTRIHVSTAQTYKEKLLGLRTNYVLRPPVTGESDFSERLSSGFDEDFLEKHNLDKRLKIEEKRPLETDLDYTSDNDRTSEIEDQLSAKANTKRRYSEKVTEVEKRWSGEFLENRLQRNSSESSKSSYIEEFGSVSSRESIVEDRDARLLFDRKNSTKFAEGQTSIDESKRRTSEEILEDTTVSTVDSDSCLEDRIKAVDEDIAQVTNEIQTDNDDIDESARTYDDEESKEYTRWNEEVESADSTILTTTAVVHENKNFRETSDDVDNLNLNEAKNNCEKDIEVVEREERVSEILFINDKNFLSEKTDDKAATYFTVNSNKSIDPTFVVQSHRGKDGYANLIKEFTMEAGSSKMKKEEKQKKKLGFRRLLPAIFSPKDSRKDYKKKEHKERKRYDERHFARYQQNGNYTRSPDTMNLNEDIKRNVKLDNSLNGSIIEERLDEIKRELFPEQGPITSTPDHFLQADDTRLLRDRSRGQRSYTTDSSLSSIAPDERWMDRSGQYGISPDIRKYEQRQRREIQDNRRYLERKHSLQEPNHGSRSNYFFQRNHGPSGRISAPPSERYLVRPRAVHPTDRPLPEIPQSRVELSNYENYQDGVGQVCDRDYRRNAYAVDIEDYENQSGLYQNDRNVRAGIIHVPQSVPAQVKITRQPIVNQIQRAPLIRRSPKYPSPGSSQKSGDYADSSYTPNSSQKSEFSPSSSKSGEYYLHSPRSSARTSPTERPFDDTQQKIYENQAQATTSHPPNHYAEEHLYDETPSSPCHEEHSANSKAANCVVENSPEKKSDLICEQKFPSNQRSPSKNSFHQSFEANEDAQRESKREVEKSREDYLKRHETVNVNLQNESLASSQAERTSIRNISPSKPAITITTSPSAESRVLTRRAQPNDQILIASPKREAIYQPRVSRPSNETRLCDTESPVPIADSRECISGIVPIETRNQYGNQDSSSILGKSTGPRNVSSFGFSKGISRPEPIYGHRSQQQSPSQSNALVTSEIKEERRENNQRDGSPHGPYSPAESCRVDERVAWVEGHTSIVRSPQSRNLEVKQTSNEYGKRVLRSPVRESSNVTQAVCQERQHGVVQQRISSATPTSERQRSSPITNHDRIYTSANSLQCEPIYEQRQRQYQSQQQSRQGQEPMYVQRVVDPTYAQQGHSTCGSLSPSKRETRQHLEAFYWQQKALEAQRKSSVSQTNSSPRQNAPKIDLPEVREAVYWQQLKKLDEEQQRRIYQQNLMDDRVYETYRKTRTGSPMAAALPHNTNQMFNAIRCSTAPLVQGDGSYWSNVQQRPKTSPAGKLPLMSVPKGQNQPVLIVRPQQALKDRQEMSMRSVHPRDLIAGCDAQRSKSASPHLHRGEIERSSFNVSTRTKPVADGSSGAVSSRKPEAGWIYEEDSNDAEGRPRPHPIFKRGSLIGGESVEYGSTGPKRVSFSNQPNTGLDLAVGNWPTKHGTAPEPPTRRHRSEDSTSDTDSVFSHQDRRDANQDFYALVGARNACLPSRCRSDSLEQQYDANKPLPPPPPRDSSIISRRGNNARNYVGNDVRWSGEEQRAYRRRQGE